MDFVIPIVFPEYLIVVNERPFEIHVPDLVPGRELFPHFVRVPVTRLPELGHAGVLFIEGRTGTTKYYEYGRYKTTLGWVMRRPIPDVEIGSGDSPTISSLKAALHSISQQAGQKGPIQGAFIALPDGSYGAMYAYARKRMLENNDPNRPPYSLLSHSCLQFMKQVAEEGGADMPVILDPRPDGYIHRVRERFPPLDYSPKTETLSIPSVETQAAPYDRTGSKRTI
jgi:hypothetical protein